MKQAAHVLDLLEFFGKSGRPATLADISKQLGWPKSSAFKLLATLTGRGYLYEPSGRGNYYPSPKWFAVVNSIAQNEAVPHALMRLLQSVASQSGETVVLASISGMNAFFVETIESENPVRYTAEIGKTVPLHITAVGRALLSQLSSADRAAILNRITFKRLTAATLMSARDIEAQLDAGTARGHFVSNGELNEDLGGVALPLNLPGQPLAIMVAGPRYRIRPRYKEIAKLLEQQFRKIEKDLRAGFQGSEH